MLQQACNWLVFVCNRLVFICNRLATGHLQTKTSRWQRDQKIGSLNDSFLKTFKGTEMGNRNILHYIERDLSQDSKKLYFAERLFLSRCIFGGWEQLPGFQGAIVQGTKIKGPENWSIERFLLFKSFKGPTFGIFNIKLNATYQKTWSLERLLLFKSFKGPTFGIFNIKLNATYQKLGPLNDSI